MFLLQRLVRMENGRNIRPTSFAGQVQSGNPVPLYLLHDDVGGALFKATPAWRGIVAQKLGRPEEGQLEDLEGQLYEVGMYLVRDTLWFRSEQARV